MTGTGGYARPDLLVETDWLAEHGQDAGVRLIDCASPDAYRRAHIPGAVGLPPISPYMKDAGDGRFVMQPGPFAELMGRLGVTDDCLVVTYDDNNALLATRMWWALRYYGHTNTKVLNGGWYKWLSEGRPVTPHATRPEPAVFTAKPSDDVICGIDRLQSLVGANEAQIFDVRSAEEFAGTNSRGNSRTGHVPGATHTEWLDFVTRDNRRVFKPAEEISALLDRTGLKPERETVTYCQAGIRAAHVMFVLALMGFERVSVYDGSMKEWANRADTPLVVP